MTSKARLTMKYKLENKEFVHQVYTMLKDGRRYFGRAGVSLENQLNDPKYKELENENFKINRKAVTAGISGEKETSKILRQWMLDKNDVVLIDSISFNDNSVEPEEDDNGQLDLADTDHVLIIGNSLVIIDSKNWKNKTSYKVEEDGEIKRGGKSFKGNRPRMSAMKYIWENKFKDMNIEKIHLYVTIPAKETFILRDRNWWQTGYKLTNQETLIYFLDKLYKEDLEEEDKGFIRVDLVAQTLTGLNRPYNKFRAKFGAVYDELLG